MAPYLTNRQLLAAISASKKSYCWLRSDADWLYDEIGLDLAAIAPAEGKVARVMRADHVPMLLKLDARGLSQKRHKTPFPPFSHYRFEDGAWIEVCRSHWEGSLHNGRFNIHLGAPTREMARMWMLLAAKIAAKSNWRGYSFVEDFQGRALCDLSQHGLKFDESRGQNPFAYYSQLVGNSFITTLAKEKKQAAIRAEMLAQAPGFQPTHAVMAAAEIERYLRDRK